MNDLPLSPGGAVLCQGIFLILPHHGNGPSPLSKMHTLPNSYARAM